MTQTDGRAQGGSFAESALKRLVARAPVILFQLRLDPDGSLSIPFTSAPKETLLEASTLAFIHGASRAEDLVHPGDIHGFREAIRASASNLSPFQKEFRIGGECALTWIQAHAIPEREPEGSVLWHGVMTEITQRRMAEDALRESEERYHSFIQHASEGIYRMELDAPIPLDLPPEEQVDLFYDRAWLAECNQRFAEMYQAESSESLIGRRAEEFHGGRDNPTNREQVRRIVRSGFRVEKEETVETTLQGGIRHFLNSGTGIFEDGNLVRFWGSQMDITDQRLAEREARTQERILREVAANFPKSYLSIIEKDLTVGFTSGQAFQRKGLDPDNFRGMKLEEVFGEHAPLVREHYQAAFAGEEQSFELTFEGEYQAYKVVPLVAPDGSVPRILAVVEDITDRRQEEIRLRDALERIARQNEIIARIASSPAAGEGNLDALAAEITESVSTTFGIERVGVWLFDDGGARLVCVDLYEAGSGEHSGGAVLTQEEFSSEFENLREAKYIDAHDAMSDPRVAGYREGYLKPLGITSMLDGVIRASGRTLGVLCLEKVDRTHHWVADEIAFVCQLADQIGMAVQARERHEAQEVLRESEARWQFALEGAGDGLWDWNAETNAVFFSRQWKAMLGYEEEEIGASLSEWQTRVHPDDIDSALQEVRRHLDGETPVYVNEHRIRCKDGTYKWVLDRGKVISRAPDGSPLRVIGTHTDIDARKRAEEEKERLQTQLLQSQKMESVGRLAGGVAHDFNNMLGVILGHTELALTRTDLPEDLRADLLEIQKAGIRSADLTGQLLAFARLQTVAPKILDLNDTAGGMLRILQRLIGEDIHLVWAPGRSLWPIRMDAAQVDQILANLCINARDAISGVGKITIETDNRTVGEAYVVDHPEAIPGDYVMLAVSDDGQGMEREVLEHLFEPFFTTKEVGAGTGLGLATVYGIVRQNDGFINVYSEPGEGTTFKIYLPRVVTDEVGESSSSREGGLLRSRGETVLLVEDEPSILKVGSAMLRQLGYTVLTAGSPTQAKEVAETHPGEIQILITDVVMPEMNGKDLAAYLQGVRPGMACLYMSGYTANVIAHHGVLDEGVHFIQKPFSLKDLATRVREALGQ